MPIDPRASHLSYQVQLELTTDCNLRCAYCFTLHPDHDRSARLDLAVFRKFLDELLCRQLKFITICGFGELTTAPIWREFCREVLDRGIALQVTSNLARELKDDEADTLSRCSHINTSCDTVDVALFRSLRRGADLRTVVFNIGKIRAAALRARRPPPQITWFAVVTDQTVFGLKDLVNYGMALGVRGFHFCNFCKHDTPQSAALQPISSLPLDQLQTLPGYFAELYAQLSDGGGWAAPDAGLLDGVKTALAAARAAGPTGGRPLLSAAAEDEPAAAARIDNTTTAFPAAIGVSSVDRGPCYTAPQPAGCTRDCLLPWHYTYVSANGDVKPCCVRPPIGTIHQGLSLDTILNSSQMIALRDGLLRGEPDGWCRGCPEAPWAPVAKLNTKVRAYLESGVLPNTYMTERQRYVDLHYDPLAMQRERDDIRADRDRLLAQIDADQREQARGMMSIRTLSRALMRAIAERLRLRVLTRRATS